jgi:long-chain acyl-CoA synthetase
MTEELHRERHNGVEVLCYVTRPHSIPELLSSAAQRFPDRPALVTSTETLTYAQLQREVGRMANGLGGLGVKRGDRILVLLPNDARICVVQLAAAHLGAMTACLNVRFEAPELAVLARRARPTIAIVDSKLAGKLPAAALPVGCRYVETEKASLADLAFQTLLTEGTVTPSQCEEDGPAFMLFTSGTTGLPKGALITHGNAIHSAVTYARYFNSTPESVTLIVMPMYYATGIIAQMLHMFVVGGCFIAWPQFTAREVTEAMVRYRVSYFMGVPTMYQLMLLNPQFDRRLVPEFQIAAYGGSPMPGETLSELLRRFPTLSCFDAYGLTETSSPATIMTPDALESKWGSVGRGVPGAELRVIDDAGDDLAADQVGELLIKGPMVIPGYWDDPEASRDAIVDGWLHTGDLARIDADGFVYIVDRKKDMIIRGGYKIFSVELEYLLLEHPAVQEAAVVGVPDPMFFEEVMAVIVLADGATLSAEEVQAYIRQHSADYKVPKYVRFVDVLPRNPTGKVQKRQLREALLQKG